MRMILNLLLSRLMHLSWYTVESVYPCVHILMMHLQEFKDPFFTVAKPSVFWHILSFLNIFRIYSFLDYSRKRALVS